MKIQSKEMHWCDEDDRHIVITTLNDEVVGLNYCQGRDADGLYELPIDKDLTQFYITISPYLSGKTEIERINQAIWAFFECKTRENI